MSLPRVDVVLASNRGGPFLDEAIDTALDQAGVSVRVILVDDGSPDPASLDRAAARREGVDLVRQPPRGVSAARNTGLERVDADLVAFLDDDDVWEPTLLHTLLGALSDDPAAVGAYCGGFYLDAAGHRFGVGWSAPPASREDLLRGAIPIPTITTLLLHADACAAVGGFDSDFELGEDNDFVLRLLQRGSMIAVDLQLVGYRRHQHNTTNGDPRARAEASDRLIRLNRARAIARGDARSATLLAENLRRFRAGVARGFGQDLPGQVRSRQFGPAWDGVRAGVGMNPPAFAAGILESVVRFARRSCSRGPRLGSESG
jgi:glycosyltransferase involved in cell wall biosynthesis